MFIHNVLCEQSKACQFWSSRYIYLIDYFVPFLCVRSLLRPSRHPLSLIFIFSDCEICDKWKWIPTHLPSLSVNIHGAVCIINNNHIRQTISLIQHILIQIYLEQFYSKAQHVYTVLYSSHFLNSLLLKTNKYSLIQNTSRKQIYI